MPEASLVVISNVIPPLIVVLIVWAIKAGKNTLNVITGVSSKIDSVGTSVDSNLKKVTELSSEVNDLSLEVRNISKEVNELTLQAGHTLREIEALKIRVSTVESEAMKRTEVLEMLKRVELQLQLIIALDGKSKTPISILEN